MTLNQLSDIANALSQRFAPKLARQYNRSITLAAALPTEVGFGKNVAWDVAMDGAVAGSYAEGADMASGELVTDALVPATLSWGHYRGGFHISETELDAAMSSAGSATALLDIIGERILSSATKVASVINVDLFTGDGTDGSGNPNIVGLHGGALAGAGSTYAGLARDTYTLWAGNSLANGGAPRALTVDLMDQAEGLIFSDTGLMPNLIVVDPAVWRKYKGLFESVRRIEGQGPLNRYDTGTANVFYMGIPVVRDKDAPSGTMTFINTEHVKKVYLPSASLDTSFKNLAGKGSNGETEEDLGMPFRVKWLASAGDSHKFMVRSTCALKVTRPAACCLLSDLAV